MSEREGKEDVLRTEFFFTFHKEVRLILRRKKIYKIYQRVTLTSVTSFGPK